MKNYQRGKPIVKNLSSKNGEVRMRSFLADEQGATVIEYALIISIIGLAVYAASTTIGESLASFFEGVGQGFAE
jgi:Flp pilus assembly pilin Flp